MIHVFFMLLVLHHLSLFEEHSAVAAAYERNLRDTHTFEDKNHYNSSSDDRNDRLFFTRASSARRQFKLDAWTATSPLQLGAPWPMRGRNQYHFAQSPFQGSASSTLQWKYETAGYNDDVLINISSCEAA